MIVVTNKVAYELDSGTWACVKGLRNHLEIPEREWSGSFGVTNGKQEKAILAISPSMIEVGTPFSEAEKSLRGVDHFYNSSTWKRVVQMEILPAERRALVSTEKGKFLLLGEEINFLEKEICRILQLNQLSLPTSGRLIRIEFEEPYALSFIFELQLKIQR